VCNGRSPGSGWRRVVASGFVAAAGAAIITALAPAGTASAAAELDVTIGVNGQFEPNDQLLVHTIVTADELIDGELVASVEQVAVTVRQHIEVPAGTTKEFYFLVPGAWDRARVEVSIREGRDEIASETVTGTMSDGELVGVLPRLAARIGELPDGEIALGDELGGAYLGAVPYDVVDLGVPALRAFDTIVAGADDLSALGDAQRGVLWAWLSTGGVLLLDDEAALGDVPEEWRPGPAGYAWAGLGEIRLTDGEAAAGNWRDVIPVTLLGSSPAVFAGTEMMVGPEGPNTDLAARAGLNLPTIAPLAIGLGVYGLVLGPVIYLVLRKMRRLTLGWFVIPTLAVLTAGGVAVAGAGTLRSGDPAESAFLQDAAGGSAYRISNVLTFSSAGGSADVDVPAGWALQGTSFFWGEGSTIPITVSRQGNGINRASVELEATQANVRTYAGTSEAGGLVTTARLDDEGEIVGTITNNTEHTFTDVAVFASHGQTDISELAPGAEERWQIRAPRDLNFNWDTRGVRVWGDPWRPGEFEVADGTHAEWGVWGLASFDIDLFPTGMVRVVGWTDGIASDIINAGESIVTGVSSLTPITSADNRVNAATVRAVAARSPFTFNVAGGTDQVIRYLLPPDADPQQLFLVRGNRIGADEVSFWDGSRWIEADPTLDPIPVPAEAIRDGAVLVLTDVRMDMEPGGIPVLTDEEPQ
jgi:hypothetical protein